VTFQRINFSGCQNAIFVLAGTRGSKNPGNIDTITFRDINGSAMSDTRGSPITGSVTNGATYRLKNLLFDNVNITFKGGLNFIPTNAPVEYGGQYPENTIWTNLPAYGFYIRHATNVIFTNCFTGIWPSDARPWMATNDVSNLKIFGPLLDSIPGNSGLVLQWKNNFVLQSATNIAGPYRDVIGASNPYTNGINISPQHFFRLRQ
jgi:hypothetical protein